MFLAIYGRQVRSAKRARYDPAAGIRSPVTPSLFTKFTVDSSSLIWTQSSIDIPKLELFSRFSDGADITVIFKNDCEPGLRHSVRSLNLMDSKIPPGRKSVE